jgi:hypothetical protein
MTGKLGSGGNSFILAGFEGFAPSEPLRFGVYDDGRLIGAADVPAVAPLLSSEPPESPPDSRSNARVSVGVDDVATKRRTRLFGPTQTVTVTVDLPPPSDGSLSFRAIDSGGRPVERYEVELIPLITDDVESLFGESGFQVDDPQRGVFAASAIPAGDWRMRIRSGPVVFDGWVGVVSIEASRETDLGTLTLQCPGALDIHLFDEAGAPAADAEVHVTKDKSATRLEFTVVKGRVHQILARSDARGDVRLELASGKVHVEVTSAGYALAFTEVDVPPNGKATCSITLKSLDPDAPPADATKR